jgi:hypothetical protein
MRLYELIDTSKLGYGEDPQGRGFIVVGSTGHYKDIVIFRGPKYDAEDFLVNPNNAFRISKRWPKVYNSRYLEVGDKFDPKKQVKYDSFDDHRHMVQKGG